MKTKNKIEYSKKIDVPKNFNFMARHGNYAPFISKYI